MVAAASGCSQPMALDLGGCGNMADAARANSPFRILQRVGKQRGGGDPLEARSCPVCSRMYVVAWKSA